MKFIVFNIVVAGALIYLVTMKDTGVDVSIPKLDEVTAAAEQVFDRRPAAEEQTQTVASVPKSENPFSLEYGGDAAAAPPAPRADQSIVDAPVIDTADLAPQPMLAPVVEAPKPLEPAVARRRAEVLGETPAAPPEPVRRAGDRRQQLLDLAEEMEYLAAEFSVQ